MSKSEVVIDGAAGEGGGQVLRTALCLSLVSGRPIRLENVRGRRPRPGLRPQHLAALRAAVEVGRAQVKGDTVGSRRVTFAPQGPARAGDYAFDVGTAGSATLVLQTVLPALALLKSPSWLEVRGGTHNPLAPPWDFLEQVYLPLLTRMGCGAQGELSRPGFYPKGGGRLRVAVEPQGGLNRLELLERGPLVRREARALVSQLPEAIGERELVVVQERLGWAPGECRVEQVRKPKGPGNALLLALEWAEGRELVSAIGEQRRRAEQVASAACGELERLLAAGVPVGQHLADQLLLLMALAGGGKFRTLPLTLHAETQRELIPRFLPSEAAVTEVGEYGELVEVEVRSR